MKVEILPVVRNHFVPVLGNTVTVMSPDGKPVQIDSSALQAAVAQNAVGRWYSQNQKYHKSIARNCFYCQRDILCKLINDSSIVEWGYCFDKNYF